MKSITVEYKIGSYSGTIVILTDETDNEESILDRARKQLNSEAGVEVPLHLVTLNIIE
jgi:hypothetical protein